MAGALKIGQWEARLGVGMEGTYGVLGTIARYVPTESMTFDYKLDGVSQDEFGVKRTSTQTYKREAMLTPSLVTSIQPNSIGEIFASFFGTFTSGTQTAGAGTQYKHTFTPIEVTSDAMRSVTFKVDYGQGTAYDYVGCRANTLNISVASKENVKATVEYVGAREIAGTSCGITVQYGSYNAPFEFKDIVVTLDGTVRDDVRALEINLNNNLSEGFRIGTQAWTTRPLPSARLDAEVKLSLEYDDVNRQRYLGGSNVGLTIQMTGAVLNGTAKNEIMFRFPNINMMTAPFEYQEGLMHLAVGGKALESGTSFAGTSKSVQVELFNNINTY